MNKLLVLILLGISGNAFSAYRVICGYAKNGVEDLNKQIVAYEKKYEVVVVRDLRLDSNTNAYCAIIEFMRSR